MDTCTSLLKLVPTSQTRIGVVQFFVVLLGLGAVFGFLQSYHADDRLTFNCSPKPDDFTRQLCYAKYTSSTSPWLIPRDVVAITLGVLCFCWIYFTLYSVVKIRQIIRDREAQPNQRQAQWRTLYRLYNMHLGFRLVFLGVMIGVFCGSQTLVLPSVFECSLHTPLPSKTVILVNQTESKMQCNDLHYKQKSILSIGILVTEGLAIVLGIYELLQLTLTRRPFQELLLGNVVEVANNLDMEDLLASENNLSGETKNIGNKTPTRAYPWNAQTVNTNCPVTVNFNHR